MWKALSLLFLADQKSICLLRQAFWCCFAGKACTAAMFRHFLHQRVAINVDVLHNLLHWCLVASVGNWSMSWKTLKPSQCLQLGSLQASLKLLPEA